MNSLPVRLFYNKFLPSPQVAQIIIKKKTLTKTKKKLSEYSKHTRFRFHSTANFSYFVMCIYLPPHPPQNQFLCKLIDTQAG